MAVQHLDQAETQVAPTILVASGQGPIVVGDGSLLFGAEFHRDGPDLVLRNEGATDIRIVDYFRTGALADLQSTDGAALRGHVVDRLAGPEAPGQYAQTGAAGAEVPIGQVESVSGTASVQRADGTAEELTQSTRVFLNDVVQTAGDSSLSITFVDGTIFTLSSDSRMVIDELIYSPDSTQNSAVFELVQGGFIFIAGQVAGSGGMEVNTPAATMGIRGTTVLADIQSEGGISTVEVTLTRDPDGGIGRVELFDLGGNLITTITGTNTKWIVSTDENLTREVDRTAADEAADNVLIAEAVAAYETAADRFAREGSYVRLDGISRDGNATPQANDQDQIDLDSEDAEGIEEPEPEAEPEAPDDGSFDEGRMQQLQQPTFDVFRTALEDTDGPVAGQLRTETNVQGQFTLLSGTSNGMLMLASDGSYSYTPNADFNGIDRFTYSVTDADGVTTTGSVTIDVVPVNDPPVIQDASFASQEDNVLLGTAVAADVDGDALTYGLARGASNGTVVVTSTGAWSYTPDRDFAGMDSFDIRVSDTAGAVATQTVTVTVAGVEDPPAIVVDPNAPVPAVVEDGVQTVSGQLVAVDPDAGDVLTWSGSAAGTYGTFEIDAAGAWTYTLGPAAQALAGQQVTDTFLATVTDSTGRTDTREVVINVFGVNDAPVAPNVNITVTGNALLQGALAATDQEGGALTFAIGAAGPQNGTLILNGDGTFTYTAFDGFAGFDGFDFTVTDSGGATTTARATIAVQSGTVTTSAGGQVSVNILPDADVGPAGLVVATSTEPASQNLNLVIALDRSGSIGADGWNTQINAVADALESLAANFGGSTTQVDVNIIAFSGLAQSYGTFDLNDPDLATTVRTLPFTGGGTTWTQPLELAEGFFDAQPLGDLNYLYFISDGGPGDPNWTAALERITDTATKGYSVTIEAFGIGDNVDGATLGMLDPDYVLLNGPEDLVQAIEATPLFAATLVDLSVRLIVDGVDLGVVADETAPGISVNGLETTLPLADIAGLAALLGDSNLISVTGNFDLDSDTATSEIQLFAAHEFTRQTAAQSLDGTAGSDLLFGSDLADVLAGNGGNDILFGFGGDDVISTGPGLDHVRAGAGNDRIILQSADAPAGGFSTVIDGGPGRDVLEVALGGDLGSAILPLIDLRGVEALDIDNGLANSLDLTLGDILGISDEADTELESLLGAALPESLTIYGDGSDSVTLTNGPVGAFVDTGNSVTDAGGNTLDIYTYVDGGQVLATLAVDSEVAVAVAPATA